MYARYYIICNKTIFCVFVQQEGRHPEPARSIFLVILSLDPQRFLTKDLISAALDE